MACFGFSKMLTFFYVEEFSWSTTTGATHLKSRCYKRENYSSHANSALILNRTLDLIVQNVKQCTYFRMTCKEKYYLADPRPL